MQQNSKCRLCGDKDETFIHIINECSKLVQKRVKDKTWLSGKGDPLELCNKNNFDHTNKWYMHNPESLLKNKMHKVLWDFELQIYDLISVRLLNLVIVKKKKKKKREPAKLWTLPSKKATE